METDVLFPVFLLSICEGFLSRFSLSDDAEALLGSRLTTDGFFLEVSKQERQMRDAGRPWRLRSSQVHA